MDSRRALILWLGVFLIGCRPATPPPTQSDQTQTTSVPVIEATSAPATSIAEEAKEILNAQYQLGATDALQVVQLTNGKFEQGTPGGADSGSVSVTDFVAVGDLNVFVDAVIHGPDEPMCCPTLRTTRHYRFIDNQLDMTDYATFTPDGKPRTITIEAPVNGTEVFTSVPIKGKVAIAPFENNLAYRIYDISGIELSAGPISVSASSAGAPGTFEALIPLGSILSGALIRIEVQDLSAADGSLLAMDSVELVVK